MSHLIVFLLSLQVLSPELRRDTARVRRGAALQGGIALCVYFAHFVSYGEAMLHGGETDEVGAPAGQIR